MRRRWFMVLVCLAAAVSAVLPDAAEARSRRGSSSTPFVMTPQGPIRRSVFYYDMYSANPQAYQAQVQAENAYLQKMMGIKTTTKPTTKPSTKK